MNKIIILIGLLVLVSGCATMKEYSDPQYFDDIGDGISNYKECHRLAKESCDATLKCDSYKISILLCDKGVCYCD